MFHKMFAQLLFGGQSSSISSSSSSINVVKEILMDCEEDEERMDKRRRLTMDAVFQEIGPPPRRRSRNSSNSSMAPPKKQRTSIADDQEAVKPPTPTAVAAAKMSVRLTRSSTRQVHGSSVAESVASAPSIEPLRKKKKANHAPKEEEVESDFKGDAETGAESKTTVVIEHCKQCNSFKTRAVLVKNGLENGVPGITVLVNPDKPRKGCFEIREEDGGTFISLLDMKRPFSAMKALDMNQVIADIIDKIK